VQEAVDWVNGRSTSRTAAINSSWAAAHWPWVQVFSTFDGKDRWYDPVIYAARQMCYTDNVAEPWFAAAGYRRGRLTKPTATEVSLSQGDRDVLYQNNINPIVNFRPEGITIFGQKTLQRIATVLDRINVRRLMIFLRKILLGLGRQYIMEPNDEFTWELVEAALNPVLSDIQNRRGLVAYRVICDETVNTPARVARNELWCKIILQPTTVAEFIVFELNLTTQAAKLGL
jgi:phage tail sheath protein FI